MKTVPLLFLSNRLDFLAKRLMEVIEQDGFAPLSPRFILIPDASLKPWLLLQLARHSSKKGVAGLTIIPWQEGIRQLVPGMETMPQYLELYLLIYQALQKSGAPEVVRYVNGTEANLLHLTQELTHLFLTYGYYGIDLKADNWQTNLLRQLFVEGPWRLPIQLLHQQVNTAPVYTGLGQELEIWGDQNDPGLKDREESRIAAIRPKLRNHEKGPGDLFRAEQVNVVNPPEGDPSKMGRSDAPQIPSCWPSPVYETQLLMCSSPDVDFIILLIVCK